MYEALICRSFERTKRGVGGGDRVQWIRLPRLAYAIFLRGEHLSAVSSY